MAPTFVTWEWHMPTKLISRALLGALSATILAAPAFAGGNCNSGNCAGTVQVMPGYAPQFGPMTIRNENPMGHLRSINFQRSPNVSITRIHGMAPTAGLSDAPSGFTGGCHPTSTTYCRQSAGAPVQVQMAPPPAPAPVYQPAPVMRAPVMQAPAQPVTVRVGGGYDPSKFAPRTYGDASLVPGIAYLPTSKVIRDPAAAQQVLNSGQTRPQDVVVPGRDTAPHMGMVRQQQSYGGQMQGNYVSGPIMSGPAPFMGASQMRAPGLTNTQGLRLAPPRMGPSFSQPSAPVLQQSGPMAGTYGSSVAPDGTYWEKTSGPTAFGSTVATQVICKRQLPRQVVNPVIGVPTPVPVPVHGGCAEHNAPGARYAQKAPGRWIH